MCFSVTPSFTQFLTFLYPQPCPESFIYKYIFPHILSVLPLYYDSGPFSLHRVFALRCACTSACAQSASHTEPSHSPDKKSIICMMFLDRRKLSYATLLTFEDLECFAAKLNSRLVSVSRSVSVSVSFPSIGGNM